MELVKVSDLDAKVLPKHERVYAREIWSESRGAEKCVVMYNEMEGDGGAEMHTHSQCEHIFYVLKGKMSVTDGKETVTVSEGESLVVPSGEPHEATGDGEDCIYLLVTAPPAVYSEEEL